MYIGILWMVSVGFIKVYEIGRRYIVPAVLRNFSRSVVLNGVDLGISGDGMLFFYRIIAIFF